MAAKRIAGVLVGTLTAVSLIQGETTAETITWNLPGGGSWNTAANWDPQDVPNEAGEEALFLAADGVIDILVNGSFTLDAIHQANPDATLSFNPGIVVETLLDGGLTSAGTIALTGNATVRGDLTNESTGTLTIPSGQFLFAYGPEIENDGSIYLNVNGGTANTYLRADAYDVLLGGTGELVLSTAGSTADAQITDYYGSWINGPDHTIRGTGSVVGTLTNQGTITADIPGEELRIHGNPKSNEGTIEGTNGGNILIDSVVLTQTPDGQIYANGSNVHFGGAANITGGVLDSSPGGAVEAIGTTYLTDIDNDGDFNIRAGVRVQSYGPTLTNNGTIRVNSNSSTANSTFRADAYDMRLDGTGEVVLMAPGSVDDASMGEYYGSWINGTTHTIRGAGRIIATMTNEGAIVADDATVALRIEGHDHTNDGTYKATGDGLLEITSAAIITQTPAGLILADGAEVHIAGGANITGGTFDSYGDGSVQVTGTAYLTDMTNEGAMGVRGGSDKRLYGSSFTNNGTVILNSNEATANAYITAGDYGVEFAGSGDLVLEAGADLDDAQIRTYYGSFVNGANHTIHGTGRINADVTNRGIIAADADGRVLSLNSGTKANEGVFLATNNGILSVSGASVPQSEAGTLRADGGLIEVTGGTNINGGRLQTANGGAVEGVSTSSLTDVTNEGVFGVRGGADVSLYGVSTTNEGTLTINSNVVTANAYLTTHAYGHRIEGSGSIVLQTAGSEGDAQIRAYYGDLTQGPSHTIRGEGQINTLLVNEGLVLADVSGRSLSLIGDAKTNRGTTAAEGGGTLNCTTPYFTNEGVVEARTDGTVVFTQRTLNYDHTTQMLAGGTWIARENGTLRLTSSPITDLRAHVLLDGPNSNFYSDAGTTDALAGMTQIGMGGKLELQSGRTFTAVGPLASTGDIIVGPSSSLTIPGALAHSPLAPRACKTIVDGILACADSAFVDGGWLLGNGTVDAFVRNTCRLSPGNSTGTLTIDGDYLQTEEAYFYVEIGGTSSGEYDHLHVTGEARLGGILEVVGLEGYEPTDGDEFLVLTHGSRVGEFDQVYGCPAAEFCSEVDYREDGVWIVVTQVAPADIEEDDDGAPLQESLPSSVELSARQLRDGATQLDLALPEAARVDLEVFDSSGRRVAILARQDEPAGRESYVWNGRDRASGVYFARASVVSVSGSTVRTARIVRVR